MRSVVSRTIKKITACGGSGFARTAREDQEEKKNKRERKNYHSQDRLNRAKNYCSTGQKCAPKWA